MRDGPRPLPDFDISCGVLDQEGHVIAVIQLGHTVYSWRTHHRRLHLVAVLDPAVQHDLVHVPVECFAGEIDELVDALEVVEDFV